MPKRSNNTSGEYRALLASFDAVFSASIAEKCVNLSDQEILAILSQSEYLKWRTRWYKGEYNQDFEESEIDAIQALAASIQDKLINGLDDCIDCQEGDCIEYAPNASIIEWSPSTPGNVNDIPAGYRQNPWYIVDESFIGGYVRGDVLCDANSTLPQSAWDYLSIIFTSGTPRFRVHVTGRGQVELHLLRLAFGGIALVWQDDDYTTADVVDLQSYSLGDIAPGTVDLLTFIDNAIDGDFSDVLIHERYFDTDGPHHIDVSFLPILDANISQLGWGGGLRKIVLCGFDENMAPVPQFRIVDNGNGCRDLQYKYDDQNELAWVTLTTICDGDDGAPGADGQPGADGSNCDCADIINDSIIQPDTNHIAPDGLDKRCNLASYLVDIPLPDLVEKLYTEKDNATANNTNLLLGLLGLGAIVVTGGIAAGFIPALYGGLALGGIATAGAYNYMAGALELIETATARAEQTAQYWQDVKCVIYCNLASDAILDDEAMIAIADAIATDIIPTYPNAGPVMEAIFRTASPEARGQWQIYGALYDGSNCDLCACAPWYTIAFYGQISPIGGQPDTPWYSKYLQFSGTTAYDPTKAAILDTAATTGYDKIEFILDVSRTPAILTKWAIDGRAYKVSPDDGTRTKSVEAWDETAQNWVTVYSGTSNGLGLDSFPSTQQILPQPTTKLRVVFEGWGTGDADYKYTKIRDFRIGGVGLDVFYLQWVEEGLI